MLGDLDYVPDVIRRFRRHGIRAIVYMRPYLANDVLRTNFPGDFDEVVAQSLVTTRGSSWRTRSGQRIAAWFLDGDTAGDIGV